MRNTINRTIVGAAVMLIGFAARPNAAAEPDVFKVPAMWEYSAPLIAPEKRERDPSRARKDPTVVFHDGKWHVFMTVKMDTRGRHGREALRRMEKHPPGARRGALDRQHQPR